MRNPFFHREHVVMVFLWFKEPLTKNDKLVVSEVSLKYHVVSFIVTVRSQISIWNWWFSNISEMNAGLQLPFRCEKPPAINQDHFVFYVSVLSVLASGSFISVNSMDYSRCRATAPRDVLSVCVGAPWLTLWASCTEDITESMPCASHNSSSWSEALQHCLLTHPVYTVYGHILFM